MLNHIVIMGRLTRDPELRKTGNGISVVSFTIACDRDYKDDSGNRETDFVDVTAWRNTAEFVNQYFTKGRMAVVTGRLQIRNWTDKEGNKRRSAEVVADNVYFGDSKSTGQQKDYAPQGKQHQQAPPQQPVPQQQYMPQGQGYAGQKQNAQQYAYPPQNQATQQFAPLQDFEGDLPF